ncbi:MAG: MBL fold metallo-hydrolase [Candidatus Thorarchaeota archaeon]
MKQSFEIYIVYDDKCPKSGFLTGFGFSVLIYNYYTKNYSLFDTGGNGNILINNIKQFNIDVSTIKNVIISHNHHDHAGGLTELLQINPSINIYVPLDDVNSFFKRFPKSNIHGVLEMTEFEKNFYISGQVKGSFNSEQAVFLKTKENEFVVLIGCAHPGLQEFILIAQNFAKIRAIIGGFHGFKKLSYLEDIEFIGACHCSRYSNAIRETFPNQFRRICVGDNYLF